MGKTNQKPIPCELVSPDAEAIARAEVEQMATCRCNHRHLETSKAVALILERNQLAARVTELEAALAKYADPVRDAGNDMEIEDYK